MPCHVSWLTLPHRQSANLVCTHPGSSWLLGACPHAVGPAAPIPAPSCRGDILCSGRAFPGAPPRGNYCACAVLVPWPAAPVRTKTKYSTCLVLLLHTCVYDVFHGTPRGPVEFVPDPCVVSPVPIPSRPTHHSSPDAGSGLRPNRGRGRGTRQQVRGAKRSRHAEAEACACVRERCAMACSCARSAADPRTRTRGRLAGCYY